MYIFFEYCKLIISGLHTCEINPLFCAQSVSHMFKLFSGLNVTYTSDKMVELSLREGCTGLQLQFACFALPLVNANCNPLCIESREL